MWLRDSPVRWFSVLKHILLYSFLRFIAQVSILFKSIPSSLSTFYVKWHMCYNQWTCNDSLLPPKSIVYIKVHFGVGHFISLHKYIMTCFCHNNTSPSIFTSPTIMSAFPVLHALAATQYCYRLPWTGCHAVQRREPQHSLSVRLWRECWLVFIEPAKILYYIFYNYSIIHVNFRKLSEVQRRKKTTLSVR